MVTAAAEKIASVSEIRTHVGTSVSEIRTHVEMSVSERQVVRIRA
jgi:hypothetical protein